MLRSEGDSQTTRTPRAPLMQQITEIVAHRACVMRQKRMPEKCRPGEKQKQHNCIPFTFALHAKSKIARDTASSKEREVSELVQNGLARGMKQRTEATLGAYSDSISRRKGVILLLIP